MGAYLFNFHVKTGDAGSVALLLRDVHGCLPAVVSQTLREWVSVYPENTDVIPDAARSVSRRLDAVVVAFEVYDSDSCLSRVYRRGRLIARDRTNGGAKRGDATRFQRHAKPGKEGVLAKALVSEPILAEETAKAIGDAYGIGAKRIEFSYAWMGSGHPAPKGAVVLSRSGKPMQQPKAAGPRLDSTYMELRGSGVDHSPRRGLIEPVGIVFETSSLRCMLSDRTTLVVPRDTVKKLQCGDSLTFILADGRGVVVPEKYARAAAEWF